MEYRKVGRGGAGNYYSPADIEAAAKKAHKEDLEAQRNSSTSVPTPQSQPSSTSGSQSQLQSQQPQYFSSGRGGAGNLTTPTAPSDPSSITDPNTASAAAISITPTLSESRSHAQSTQHYGRGGAGNFRGPAAPVVEEKPRTETKWDDRGAAPGLQAPERAFLGGEREKVGVEH